MYASSSRAFKRGCSTPEGIGGGISRRALSGYVGTEKSAQRPKASEGESGAQKDRTGDCLGGAQRPKASEGESAEGSITFLLTRSVCSTPEGIGGGISLSEQAAWSGLDQCSTPEGIGGGIRRRSSRGCAVKFRSAQRPKASEGESGSQALAEVCK